MFHLFKISFFSLLVYLSLAGCGKKDSNKVKVTLRLDGGSNIRMDLATANMLTLDTVLLATTKTDSGGLATFELALDRPTFATIKGGDEFIPLYLNPGDEMTIEPDKADTSGSMQFTGDGAGVQEFLENCQDASRRWELVGGKYIVDITPEEFIVRRDSLQNTLSSLLENLKKNNSVPKSTKEIMVSKNKMVMYDFQQRFINSYYKMNPDDPAIPQTLKEAIRELPVDSVALAVNMYDYASILAFYMHSRIYGFVAKQIENINKDSLVGQWAVICDTTIQKGALAPFLKRHFRGANIAYWVNNEGVTPELARLRADFLESDKTAFYAKMLTKSFGKWAALAPGKPAPDFTGTTANGKKISLSSLKGKLVYVDIWATWCGPCREEFPHSKKLMKEFEGNDKIAFLYVSTDENIDAWKKLLPDQSVPAGIHINQKQEKQPDAIWDNYHLWGIPRYLLIDANGNMLKTHAPRPSSEDILPLLKGYLKES